MPFTDSGKNTMLTALGATHVAVFQGDPSTTGVELERLAITFNAPAAGSMDQVEASIDFAIAAGETVDHIGYFDAAVGGTLLAYDPVTAESFAAAGTYKLTETTMTLTG